MPSSTDMPSADKLYWLTQPRYVCISWPPFLAGFGFFTGHWPVAMGLLAVMACGGLRLTKLKLLPHERRRLEQASAAIHSAQPACAVTILQADLRFAGAHYQLKRAALLSRAYCRQGRFLEAHAALAGFKQQHLQKDEELHLQVAWAQLYLEADNPSAARRRLCDRAEQKCTLDLNSLLVQAELELLAEDFSEARRLLESGLDRYQEPGERILLHNLLARLELLQERTDAQLRHLQAARREFNRQPSADLTHVIHHNLAIAMVRNGQPEEAKAVLAEAQAAIERDDLQQVIELLNNQLLAAREAGDAKWIQDVYAEFDRQLDRLQPNTEREQLVLDISELRMRRNDSVERNHEDYPARIERLLHRLENASAAIPIMDRLHGLSELQGELKHEIDSYLKQSGQPPKQLEELIEWAAKQMLKHSDTIDTQLSSISPLLIGPLKVWHRFRTDADKARIQLAETPEQLQVAFARLFNHLREKAEWMAEQGTSAQAIESWLVLCDELVAYHDQAPLEIQPAWRHKFAPLAQHALEQATRYMSQQKQKRLQIDQMIGLAYFHLRLRGDKEAAAYWIDMVDSYHPSLHQYALWLREHYEYVCGVLGVDGKR